MDSITLLIIESTELGYPLSLFKGGLPGNSIFAFFCHMHLRLPLDYLLCFLMSSVDASKRLASSINFTILLSSF